MPNGIDLAEVSEVAKLWTRIRHQGQLPEHSRRRAGVPAAESFDLVCCLEILSTSPPPQTVKACAQLTKAGGTVFPPSTAIQRLCADDSWRGIRVLTPRGTHDYASSSGHPNRPVGVRSWPRGRRRGLRYNPRKSASLADDVDAH